MLKWFQRLFGKKQVDESPDWLNELSFYRLNNAVTFYTVTFGKKVTDKEFEHMLNRSGVGKLFKGPEKSKHYPCTFDELNKIRSEFGISSETDRTAMVQGIALHIVVRTLEETKFNMTGDVVTLKNGDRVGVQAVWSNKLPDGRGATLFVLVAVTA